MKSRIHAPVVALVLAAHFGCASARVPNPRLDPIPGSLETLYKTSAPPAGPQRPLVGCRGREFTTDITEIALERSACYGLCRMYTVVLHADGTATYSGRGNVPLLGEHTGTVDPGVFPRLAAMAEEV